MEKLISILVCSKCRSMFACGLNDRLQGPCPECGGGFSAWMTPDFVISAIEDQAAFQACLHLSECEEVEKIGKIMGYSDPSCCAVRENSERADNLRGYLKAAMS